MDTLTAIASRRTCKSFSRAPVPRAVLERLLEAAAWAPTHRMTQPWRFAVLDQAAIARLITMLTSTPAIAAVPDPEKGAAKLAKLTSRLPSLGAIIHVTWVRHTDPAIDGEDHAAACAATQNLLLAATALGLGSFWSTTPALGHPTTLAWCGADPAREGFIGSLWLGTASETPPPPTRLPLAAVTRWC